MNLKAWRIVSPRVSRNAFDGEGARRYGGRWNSPGTSVVYLSEAISLALLEILVHLQGAGLLGVYVLHKVEFDDALVEQFPVKRLPPRWKSFPPDHASQSIGDQWVRDASSPILKVPSVIVERESNYLLNPHHPHFSRVTVGPEDRLRIDRRLLAQISETPKGN